MKEPDQEFLESLRAAFKTEAADHCHTITSGLLDLERNPTSARHRDTVETIFREAHSLKGAARAINQTEIEGLCQAMESVFGRWQRQGSAGSPSTFDTVYRAVDAVKALLTTPPVEGAVSEKRRAATLVAQLTALATAPASPTVGRPAAALHEEPSPAARPASESEPAPAADEPLPASPDTPPPAPPVAPKEPLLAETVRVATAKLDRLLVGTEEMLALRPVMEQRAKELREALVEVQAWARQWSEVSFQVRASVAPNGARPTGIAATAGIPEFVEWTHAYLPALVGKLEALSRSIAQDGRATGNRVEELLEETKRLLLFPFSTLSGLFPKLVRDLGRDQGKEIDLVIQGEEVEIDKRILESIKSPLIHLLRNAIDHGIEPPQTRAQRQKPTRGTITIALTRVGGDQVEIRVADDGGGIEAENVRRAAVKHRVLSEKETAGLGESEVLPLIFESGISTSPILTEISGRGLGLAIVRDTVARLGGRVAVENRPGSGVAFRIRLPVRLATLRGLLVQTRGQLLVVPTTSLQRVLRIRPSEVKTVENRETITVGGAAISLVWLGDILGLARKDRLAASEFLPVLLLAQGERRVAFAVDEVLTEHEVLFKPFRKPLARVRNIAGATILGSGKPVLILNVADLIQSAITFRPTLPSAGATVLAPAKGAAQPRILVVEDSITSRMLLKNILESAGYRVKTAVDGADALATLKTETFDLVVSDIEMPRLNGFDLTARIRSDKKLTELPVVLVTALASREDRERGVEAGANAYLVKSSFDQGSLLETIRRLI